ncbi:MAG: hypothetical protein U5K79_03485 [Cyclobacteriaceae bacterium]|nr:hypothetical protein [Cyclobacteriaceae bacterium]
MSQEKEVLPHGDIVILAVPDVAIEKVSVRCSAAYEVRRTACHPAIRRLRWLVKYSIRDDVAGIYFTSGTSVCF